MSGTGDAWVSIVVGNLRHIFFWAGVIMILVSPLVLFRTLRRRSFEDIGKFAIISMFGVAFFLAGLLWGGS